MSEVTVAIVDDDEAVGDAIGTLLDTVDLSYQVFQSANAFLAADVSCACIVLDVRMPGMSGLELQQTLIEQQRRTPIIFVTGHGDIPMAVDAMRNGAVDFIRKPFRDQELLDRINDALTLDHERRRAEADRAKVAERINRLTAREREVFDLVAIGRANKTVAIDLGISERTVEIHRSHVMQKTESRTLADLVRLKIAHDELR